MTSEPVKSALSNQPAKVYPVLVLVAVEVNCWPVLVVAVVMADPELVLKVTFRMFALHLA